MWDTVKDTQTRVIIALARNAGCLQNGSHMLLLTLDFSCFMLVLQKEARRQSSMCDPFCENPAFFAIAILTLVTT